MNPNLLSNPPQPIDDLLVPVRLRPLAELVPEPIVVLHCSLVVLVGAEHGSCEVFVLLFRGDGVLFEDLLELEEVGTDDE